MIMFKIAESANYGPHLIANVSHYVFGSMTSSLVLLFGILIFFWVGSNGMVS